MKRLHPAILKRLTYEPDGCLVYGGSLDRGYGKACVVLDGQKRTLRVHRYLYETLIGEVPEGLELDHLCRNRACANPHHLEAVTRAVNLARIPGWQAATPVTRRRRLMGPFDHGQVQSYWRGCRCDPCKAAGSRYRRQSVQRPCRHCGGLT